MGRPRLRTAFLMALLFGCLTPVSTALAHANLLRSNPPDLCGPLARPQLAPADPRCLSGAILTVGPDSIRLFFSEKAEPFAGGISVLSPSGRRVDKGAVRAAGAEMSVDVDAAEAGTYLVRWRVIASDTHPAKGSFAFSVGHATPRPGGLTLSGSGSGDNAVARPAVAFQALARFLHFAGYALAFGALAFLLLVLQPLGAAVSAIERRLYRLANIGVALMLAACILALLAQTASLTGAGLFDPAALSDVLASSLGRVLVQQAGVALLLWVLLGPIREDSRASCIAALILGAALALADTEASHAAANLPWLAVPATALHIALMGLWVGGLAALLSIWFLPEIAGHRATIGRRFGLLAAPALLLLVATGSVMTVLRLSGPSDLPGSAYGRALLAKLLLVFAAALLAFAGRHDFRHFRERWWKLESLSLAGVVALAALLVSLSPPR